MSIPAQGAVGAETMTAGRIAYDEFSRGAAGYGFNHWKQRPPEYHEAWERIASAVLNHAALASPRADSDERTAGEVLKEACKPWEYYTGEPPDDGSPLSGVFVAGMVYTERLLAKLLGVAHYEGGDGSEDFDADATQTLRNILTGARLWDADENRPVSATPAQPAGDVPDSLRALSEAATAGPFSVSGVRKRYDEASCVIVDAPSCGGLFAFATAEGREALAALADAKFVVAAANHVRDLIASRSAGQSGDGDERYKIGRQEGYYEGVKDAAIWVGIAGEYSTSSDPERQFPDASKLLERIADHMDALEASVERSAHPATRSAGTEAGWVVANALEGPEQRFRRWGQIGPEWTADCAAALWFARRSDADAFAAEDEDAWRILPVTALASHPAGQSTGQGADTEQCERCQGNGEIVTDWQRYLHGESGDVGDEGTADCPDCGGIGEIDTPAPDSPLTGPVGTEIPEGAIHNGREHLRRLGLYGFTANDGHVLDCCEDYIGAQQCFEVMAEALAARPAAPEAQEAWSFDMEAAPRDGASLLCVEYDEPEKVVDLHWFRDGGTASSWRGSFGQLRRPIAWCRLLAPPASSGQEG